MRLRGMRFIADLLLIAVTGTTVTALLDWDSWSSEQGALLGRAGQLVTAGCAAAAVLVRRELPAVALTGAAVLMSVEPLTGGALAAVAYTAGLRWARLGHRVFLVAVCMVVPTAVTVAIVAGEPTPVLQYEVMVVLVTGIVCGVLPGLAGALAGQRERLVRALAERNAFLERAHQSAEEQARTRERARIAGEMHDLLGHRLSLIALHSGGLEMASEAGDPEVRRSALLVHSTVRQAMAELRDILGVLRAGDPVVGAEPLTPTTGTRAEVAAMVSQSRTAGIAVGLEWTGEDLAGESAPARRAVDRVVREALTNVHKHAAAADVQVVVRRDARQVRVEVRNGPETGAARPWRLPGSDLGLVGLHERIRLLGGTLRAEPADTGGYAVVAHIPLGAGPAVASTPPPAGHHVVSSVRTWWNQLAIAAAVALGVVGVVALQFVTLAFVPYPDGDGTAVVEESAGPGEYAFRTGDPAGPPRPPAPHTPPHTVRLPQ
ncbi:histidine kinase [Streptomyces sp. NBC_00250]|uniref:sensor histidine kinase n=1 Tax=Streptomyces sp. NBC_00250 TaxID=2903641 RepID=UPI002E2B02F4|nr:histidine kinase [Streptomyces sp. NBC_00250]